ncbi:MAG: hypothetical protein WA160_05765 [Pseudobdellovibrio sp.]
MRKNNNYPKWADKFENKYNPILGSGQASKNAALLLGYSVFSKIDLKKHSLSVQGQPFDSELLHLSSIYRKSRKLYLDSGGTFTSCYVSKDRLLLSSNLLYKNIEYNSIEKQLDWASQQSEQKRIKEILFVNKIAVNIFHEQNHRILMKILPAAPIESVNLRRYLNFTESLVVAIDLCLGHQINKKMGLFFQLVGVTYQQGFGRETQFLSKRIYRDYLHAYAYSVFLSLCLYPQKEASKVIGKLFFHLDQEILKQLMIRSYGTGTLFGKTTNIEWQKNNKKEVIKVYSKIKGKPLVISSDPLDYSQLYHIGEQWFDMLGL